MGKLKSTTLAFLGAAGLAMAATSASADLWSRETVMTRDMTFYTPRELDLSGDAATPAVFVFDEEAPSGADIAARFRLWEFSEEKGFKVVFVGGMSPERDISGAPSAQLLFEMMMARSVSDKFVDPRNSFVVGFGQAAGRAFQYACDHPGQIRGIVAIDFQGFDEPLTCGGAQDLFVLSVHDGQPPAAGAAGNSGSRDLSAIEPVLSELEQAGATVQRIALSGADDRYPDFSAKFFDEKKVPLDKLSAAFVGQAMVK